MVPACSSTTPTTTPALRSANSTFSGNDAVYGDGAGLWTRYVTGDALIENATVSGNSANYDGGGDLLRLPLRRPGGRRSATRRSSTTAPASNPGLYAGPYGGGGVFLYDDSEDTTAPIVEERPG